eukprot:TRINITY_DN5035_c0_g1_i1.p1 TRINITY_DN5035_c0_g1~~TRINITY_DN5035_c0_g1_i1.p1  ORF type:complete len:237 (+),score=34.66 TRINITY_DN5035_c0_g1_i1:52-762(+)
MFLYYFYFSLLLCLCPGVSSNPRDNLIRRLLVLYNKELPPYPLEDERPITLRIGISPVCLDLSVDGDLEGTLWYNWEWRDHRLTWEGGPSEIHLPKESIYVPDLLPINNYFRERFHPHELVEIRRNGSIVLHSRVWVKGPCSGYKWENPWAPMDCSLSFTPWTHSGATMRLEHGAERDAGTYQRGCPTEVIDVQAHTWNQYHVGMEHPYVFYDFNLVLQRNWMTLKNNAQKISFGP